MLIKWILHIYLENPNRVIKMKTNIYSIEGEVTKEIELPEVFEIATREDLIHKAFRAISYP
jgi:Ribosomal protein L4